MALVRSQILKRLADLHPNLLKKDLNFQKDLNFRISIFGPEKYSKIKQIPAAHPPHALATSSWTEAENVCVF